MAKSAFGKKKKKDDSGSKGKGEQSLERALSQIEKQYGQGAIMRLGDTTIADVSGISTGSLSLDIASVW